MQSSFKKLSSVLTIAGSDSGGGAGIQADLKTFAAHKIHGLSVITALTAQNTCGVSAVNIPPTDFLEEQIAACFNDFDIQTVKLGMLANTDIIKKVSQLLHQYQPKYIVLDPVMIATSGAKLLEDSALDALRFELLPLATIVTPNLPEAEFLLQKKITTIDQMHEAADQLLSQGCQAVLLKGGHLAATQNINNDIVDILATHENHFTMQHPRLMIEAHGTGCTLASAIAANLGHGLNLYSACQSATKYVHRALNTGYFAGKGGLLLLNHFAAAE